MSFNKKYVFSFPTRVEYGIGALQQLASIIKQNGGTRVFIITDPGVVKVGLVERITAEFSKEKISYTVFCELEPNPRDKDVINGLKMFCSEKYDVIIGLGGGSSMDTAKMIRALKYNGGTAKDYEGFDQFKVKPDMPLICIPTTSGTGSEVGGFAVITDTERKVKMGIGDASLIPTFAVVDPLLTVSMPPQLTASTGVDALSHAIEVYVSNIAQPMTDALALKAIELCGLHIRKAVGDGSCLESRSGMAEASMMAGSAMSNCDCGAVHAMAESAGGLYDSPHGLAIAVFLPFVMEYNLIARPEKYARIAEALGARVHHLPVMEGARASVSAVRDLLEDLGMLSPGVLGLKKEDIPLLSQMAMENISTPGNPRTMSYEAYLELFQRVYVYGKGMS